MIGTRILDGEWQEYVAGVWVPYFREGWSLNMERIVADYGTPSLNGTDAVETLKVALTNWWIDLAHEEVERVVPKAIEYGSTDLLEVGRTLANVIQREGLGEEELVELGIYFYLVGKFARWMDAVRDGRRPSDDTLHDIGVYVRMAQRTRAVGGWPAPHDEVVE